MQLTVNGHQIEATDCRSWRVVGMQPDCELGLPLDCGNCSQREARRGDGTDPPIYVIPQSAIRPPNTPAASLPAQTRVGGPRPGLGDVVARVASAVGIKPTKGCGCKKRQEALNRLVPFGKQSPPAESQRPAGPTGG